MVPQPGRLAIQSIPPLNLAAAAIPALLVIVVLWRWHAGAVDGLVALVRMVAQLLLVGYVLVYIFETDTPFVVLGVIAVMVLAASWIALRTIARLRRGLFGIVFASVAVGGGLTLVLITQGVLTLEPWYAPSITVPLAGMIFAASMNSISISAERIFAELDRGLPFAQARSIAMQAGLIPITNSLLAVGLVSLPGFMTGQILSGVSPLIAVRYQVMVMCMVFGAAGLSAGVFLLLLQSHPSLKTNSDPPLSPTT